MGVKRSCNITPVLKKFHWLSVVCRMYSKILLLTFKCIQNLAAGYLANLLKKPIAQRSARSARDEHLLERMRICLVTTGDGSFAHVAPKLWNEPPYSMRVSRSLVLFKKIIKLFQFQRFFCDNL